MSRSRQKGKRNGQGLARFRSPLPALIAALALVIQLLAIPFHHPIAAPSRAEAAAIELKALFGDNVVLCTQADDSSAPSVPGRAHCGDECPLCQFAAHAAALIVPPQFAPQVLAVGASETLRIVPEVRAPKARANALAQARAPPLAV